MRKSRVFRDKDIISPEMQLAQVTELAARHGDADLVVFTDMNKSGRKRNRPGFQALLAAIERDEVSAVYSYSLSRLSRSISAIVELAEACAAHGVSIRLARDIDPDPTTASGRLMMNLLAAMAQFEADVASERARDTVEARRARGDKLGPAFYRRPELVIQAYEETGSVFGAVRLLNERHVPTKLGIGPWTPSAARGILARHGLLSPLASRGVRARSSFALSRLLRCHCGQLMTGRADSARGGYVSYYCYRARLASGHGPSNIPESVALKWAREEAALLNAGTSAYIGDETTADKRAALLDRRGRLNRAASRSTSAEEEQGYIVEIEGIDAELGRLESGGSIVSLDAVVWDAPPDLINEQLRALWEYVEMDEQERPVRAQWRVPEWRRAQSPAPPAAAPA